jgi:RNA polymerase sigma factor (sigma-70 family)
MQELDDIALLREYVAHDSEEAFATLVTRHVNKVYSVALRHTSNPDQAEEITQAVFVILARKSRHLGRRVILSGWLYQTARLTAVTFGRSAIRRAHREQEAHMQTVVNEKESDVWPEIAPLLDAAMASLNETDRHAVVLRFFDGKSMNEVGAALGGSEGAATLRLHRAVEKLRQFFLKRGIASTTDILTGAIAANSVQAAPAALAKSVAAVAVAKGAAASGSTLTLIKGALKIMAWTKAKTIIVAGVAVIFTAAVVTPAVIHRYHRSNVELSGTNSGVLIPAAPDNAKTAEQAARGIFKDWAKGDWDAFFTKFGEPGVPRATYDKAYDDEVRSLLVGLEIVSVGEPTNGFPNPNMWCVPCKIRFKGGEEHEFRLNVAQNPQTKRWHFVGGL